MMPRRNFFGNCAEGAAAGQPRRITPVTAGIVITLTGVKVGVTGPGTTHRTSGAIRTASQSIAPTSMRRLSATDYA